MSIINNLFHRLNLADDSASLDVLRDNASSHSSLSFLSKSQENSLKQPMIRLFSQILDPPEQSHSPPSGLTLSQLGTTGLSGTMGRLLSQLPAFSNSNGGGSGGGSLDSGGGITPQPAPAPIVLGLPATATFQENAVNILADSLSGGASVTVMDANSTRFHNLRVGYKNGSLAEDRLSIRNQGNGAGQIGVNGSTVSYGGVTIGTISAMYNGLVGGALLILFNENATTAAVEALLENITYQNSSNNPTESRIITIDLDDGDGSPLNTVEIEVIVTPEDDYFITSALDNISAGDGDDVITGDADDLQAGDTIDGGADLDSIDLLTPGSGTIGADVSNVEQVRLVDTGSYTLTITTPAMAEFTIDGSALTGTNALSVDASAYAGNLTILGGQGNDAVTVGSGNYAITLNAGNDSVISADANFDNTITVTGGTGTDTIRITDSAAISAADLANITGVDVIDVSAAGATSIVLSDAFVDASDSDVVEIANGASIVTSLNTNAVNSARMVMVSGTGTVQLTNAINNRVVIKDGVNGIVQTRSGDDTIIGGTGNDQFYFAGGANLSANDSLSGGMGTDRLISTGGNVATILAADLANKTGIDQITFTATGSSIIFTDAFVDASDSDSIEITHQNNAHTYTVDSSAVNSARDVVIGTGAAIVLADGVNNRVVGKASMSNSIAGGTGIDTLSFANASFTSADTLDGGGSNDILQFTTVASQVDAAFANKTSIEQITLGDFTGQTLTLAANAQAAGITTVDGSANTGTNTVSVNASAYTVAISIAGGAGNDTIRSNSGNDTITGNDGADSIFSASGNDSLDGGAGNDTFTFANANFDANDSIAGGTGTDTITFTDATTIAGAALANKTGIDAIDFTLAASSNTLTLTDAFVDASDSDIVELKNASGIFVFLDTSAVNILRTVRLAGGGTVTLANGVNNRVTILDGIAQSVVNNTGTDTVIGGTGANEFRTNNANFIAGDVFTGGAGNDYLHFLNAATITAANLANKTGVDQIRFDATGNTVTLSDAFVDAADNDSVELSVTTAGLTITLDTSSVNSARNVVIGNMSSTASIFFTPVVTLANGVNNRVLSKAGVDTTIISGTGSDTILGNTGNDSFAAGSGSDSLDGGAGDDSFYFTSADFTNADTVAGAADTDTLIFTDAASLVDAAFANKTGIERITLGDFNAQTLTLSTNAQAMGLVTIDGSALTGANTVSVDASAFTSGVVITGGAGSDTLNGGSGNDTIISGTGNNTIDAGIGADSIDATAGNDAIRFSAGELTVDDTIQGAGASGGGIQLNAAFSGNLDDYIHMSGIRSFLLNSVGATFNFTLTDAFYATNGVSSFTIQSGTVASTTVDGSALTGNGLHFYTSNGDDYFANGAADGTVNVRTAAYTNADTLVGGAGNDILVLRGAAITLDLDAMTNTTGFERITLNDNAAHSLTFGNYMYSTAGFVGNTFTVTTSNSTVGVTVDGSAASTALKTASITGGGSTDSLVGTQNNDTISGGADNDSITGGGGVDSLIGGAGNDVFYYLATTNSGTGVGNRDIITDFVSGTDDIDLSAMAGMAFRAGGNGVADFSGAPQVAWQQSGGNTIVYVDTDGDDTANFEIQLTGLIALVAGDFVL